MFSGRGLCGPRRKTGEPSLAGCAARGRGTKINIKVCHKKYRVEAVFCFAFVALYTGVSGVGQGLFAGCERVFRGFVAHFFLIILEEIVIQNLGNSQQELRVDALALEDVVHIGAFAIEFLGEPGDGAFLAVEFFFDKFPNVYHRCLFVKKAEPFVTYPTLRHRQAPDSRISTNSSRP